MIGKKFLAFSLSAVIMAGSAMSASAAGVKDVFDANTYANKYSDLKTAYGTDVAKLLEHFKAFGAKEGRVASPILDVAAYRKAYADLNAVFGDNWDSYVDHYLAFGIREGRTAGVLFDLVDYANQNPDLKAAYGEDYAALAKHYVQYGIKEGRKGGQIVQNTAAAASSSNSSSNSGSSSGDSNSNSGNGGTTTPPAPTTPAEPPVVAYGHEHNWDAMIKNGTAEVVEFEAATCEHAGYINYRCTELVTCIWYTDGTAEWMLTDEIPDGSLGKGVKFHNKTVDWFNVSQCSATSGRRTVAQLHHTVPTDGAYIVDHPTCTQAGVASYVCETCGKYVDKEAIPALGHAWNITKTVTATSCNEAGKGYDEQTCARCGLKDQINPVYKHSVAKYTVTKNPTCTTEGSEVGYCSVCTKEDVRKVAMLDHGAEPVSISVDTYVKDGNNVSIAAHATYNVIYCPACNYISSVSADTTTLIRNACVDDNNDGLCDDCKRPMDRTLINSEKLYKVGEYYNNTVIQ